MNPFDFGGQRSKVKVTMVLYGKSLVNLIETEPLCLKLGRHINYHERMNPIDVLGQKSKGKVTILISILHTFCS